MVNGCYMLQKKTVFSFCFLIILSSPFLVQSVNCEVFYTDGLWWWISGTREANTGEMFTIDFQFTPDQTIEVEIITMKITGNIGSNGEVDSWEKIWNDRTLMKDETYTEEKSFFVTSLPENTGGSTEILGMVTGVYYLNGERTSFHSGVGVTTLSSYDVQDASFYQLLSYGLSICVVILILALIVVWNKGKNKS